MKLINETNQEVYYECENPGGSSCGTIAVDGVADLPQWDNQKDVQVRFWADGRVPFEIECGPTKTDQAVIVATSVGT